MDRKAARKLGIFTYFGVIALLLAIGSYIWYESSRYRLVVYAEPDLNLANIYIDNELKLSNVNQWGDLDLTYEHHKIEVFQNGYKPFVAILRPPEPGESMYGLEVKFETLDSMSTNQVPPLDTIKII